ncbi:MAG: leucine-rich repeat domain-containing protein [Ruminococcaceae bacterium]|nr:leucine-rich repeat domain-containing protein [Oscillospiraceae bacterium]
MTVTTSNGKTATCTVIVTNSIDDFKYEKNTTGYTITGVKNENKTSYVIPDSVTSIGGSAFFGCSSLTSITILDSVTSIGDSAFSRCSGLTSITIGNSVTSIGKYAFYGCTGLTSITIPDSVTSIGRSAFVGCSGLTSITIPFVGATKNGTSNTHFGYIFGAELFSNNSKYVPLMLKTVIITGGTSIGDDAFWDCSGLTSITIGNNVTSVGKSAFSGCSGLTSITIPNSVTSIGRYAFYDCRGLTSITIPNSVTSIGNWAFSGCSGLTSINFQGTKAQWNKITLGSDWKYDSGITHIICTDGPIYV